MATKLPFLIGEAYQQSTSDSGVAALKAILDVFGIEIDQAGLGEALFAVAPQLSIDTLEVTAGQVGLLAEQVMVAPDFLLLSEADLLPVITLVRLANGRTQFVVVWRRHGSLLQVMNPASGRSWRRGERFVQELFIHTQPVPVADWLAWARSAEFQAPLQQRLRLLEIPAQRIQSLLAEALHADTSASDWLPMATLDAASRLVSATVRNRAVRRGKPAEQLLSRLIQQTLAGAHAPFTSPDQPLAIPLPYWTVLPFADDPTQLLLRGAVCLRILGRAPAQPAASEEVEAVADDAVQAESVTTDSTTIESAPESMPPEEVAEAAPPVEAISPELQAAMQTKQVQVQRNLWAALLADGGKLTLWVWVAALLITGGISTLEPLLLQSISKVGQELPLLGQRLWAIALLLLFLLIGLVLELLVSLVTLQLGRQLEARLRLGFLTAIPHMNERRFHRRPISELTHRAFSLRNIRQFPELAETLFTLVFQFIFTTAAITWLNPSSFWLILLALLLTFVLIVLSRMFITKSGLQFQLASSGLSRYYLDALLGLTPLRTHGAERSLRREHEGWLVEWSRSGNDLFHMITLFSTLANLISSLIAIGIVFNYVNSGGQASTLLLLAYWMLNLPNLLNTMARLAMRAPQTYNVARLMFEATNIPEAAQPPPAEISPAEINQAILPLQPATRGVAISMRSVGVQVNGQQLLADISLEIAPGEHIGIVGSSGAGKSTLVGLLLGWHEAAAGEVLVDGQPLDRQRLQQLRRQTAWVDPGIQIWNRTLLDNLYYGRKQQDRSTLGFAIEQADLFTVLEKMPEGLQTVVGESGGLVSGGEGQRVRLGRALLKQGARLVILDEPFRGLDRDKRRLLLTRVRNFWKDATLICITHDVGEIQAFERTLVLDHGHVVEDGAPSALLAQPNSRYRALLEAEEAVREGLWAGIHWRRLWLANGKLSEREG